MKKILFALAILIVFSGNLIAQVSEGGSPLTMDPAYSSNQQYIPQIVISSPDINVMRQQDSINARKHTGLLRIGGLVNTDIIFATSGTTTILGDGQKIWRLQVRMPGAQALGLYYDHFYLPQGVRYFLTNASGKQVLGAYTAKNNQEDERLANEKVQGDLLNLEIDMDATVDPSNIVLHINKVATFYNGIGYLDAYNTLSQTMKMTGTLFPYHSSSLCERNAICPEGDSFPTQRKSAIHIEYATDTAVYGGTGVLMNNTNYDCTPYLLTASHVEPSNSTADTTYSQWIFYFNYETPTCIYTGKQPGTTQTMTGAYFKARASYDRTKAAIVGDFLLVQIKGSIPASYGAYLAGWDINGNLPTSVIGFHHPSADVKKVSTATTIYSNGDFNGGEHDSHWAVQWNSGGEEEGSSGSGLYDQSGRVIGDLGGGSPYSPTCFSKNANGDTMSNIALYSKLYLNWDYIYQTPSTASSRLRDWLDPKNRGFKSIDAALVTPCDTSLRYLSVHNTQSLANAISVYPNPTTGVTYAKINLDNASDVTISIYNILGSKQAEYQYSHVTAREYKIDLSNYANGVYMLSISTNNSVINKKVILSR